jgi:hypothetical protein
LFIPHCHGNAALRAFLRALKHTMIVQLTLSAYRTYEAAGDTGRQTTSRWTGILAAWTLSAAGTHSASAFTYKKSKSGAKH